METLEYQVALRSIPLIFRNPRWILAWIRGGRLQVVKEVMADSISVVRKRLPSGFDDLVERPPQSPLGQMGATQEYLYFLTRLTTPDVVVETGVYRGISSAFVLAALEDNDRGHLFSIDLPNRSYLDPESGRMDVAPLTAREEPGFAIPTNLRKRWSLVLGDTRQALPRLLSEVGKVDIFYHDSEHTYEMMSWEYEQVLPRISPGGFLTSDDVNRNSAFQDTVRGHGLMWSHTVGNRLGIARVTSDARGSD